MIRLAIFDWKRTLWNPDTKELLEWTHSVLNMFDAAILIGKGTQEELEKTSNIVSQHFLKRIGVSKKTKEVFLPYITDNPRETLFIGDRMEEELRIGHALGAKTLWVRHGKFKDEVSDFAPTYIVEPTIEGITKLWDAKLFFNT